MKAIILAAGYATRLYPLTLNMPKALLPIGGKPIIDHIVAQMDTVEDLDEIYVVSNDKFASHFEEWAKTVQSRVPIKVLNDGTTDDSNKRGAIGDISFVIDEMKIDDDLMVIAGDNFFTYSLKDYVRFFREKDRDCVCVKVWEDESQLSQFGIALLDWAGKVLDIEEKPAKPKSNTVVFAAYLYKKETVPMFAEYLAAGNKPDAPGNFPAWLYKKKEVYAYTFEGECYDVGTPESYHEVCEMYKAVQE
ncbi:MAG: nucleotidyltransferase family protein [Anaerotignum sp.]|nr:nucleotidyltransferase family protein [Anaerotignum sp.]MBR5793142.1 nucleotidyltransferase family protein [Anaerotignum sp.]